MIVVDTNLLAYLHFDTVHSEEALHVHEIDPDWASPILWRSEFTNVVALYLRKQIIQYKDALDAIDFAKQTIGDREYSVSPYQVLELVMESSCTSYDCEFAALALDQQTKLVTYDKKLLSQFPNIAISAAEFIKQNQ